MGRDDGSAVSLVRFFRVGCDAEGCTERHWREWRQGTPLAQVRAAVRDDGWGWQRRPLRAHCPAHNDYDNGERS